MNIKESFDEATPFQRIAFIGIVVDGLLLFVAITAVLVVVLSVHHEQKIGRENFCDARVVDHKPTTSICKEFYSG